MKPVSLFLKVYGEKKRGQWSLICLDFNLAVQADSLEEAQEKLHRMIKSYIYDALSPDGHDHQHAKALLRRRAPLEFWLKYYAYAALSRLRGRNGDGDGRMVGADPIPMVPTGA